ncbi:beta-L-arabinofuranosidase domain-containing protein [Proteiniphilum sp. UBA5384]|uniref:beta-L-arabinofuranosidase domain-containing protein n=1 Tax=Proteiniphilum sp. UBA5384 TaxID=1947279 RepID=UPI0025E01AB6|nr:beta-L-arabinofuranosidase domain-containing protein [Proteiniphilum sp. UBA5384]
MIRDISTGNSSHLEQMRKLGEPITQPATGGYGEFEGNFMDAVIRNSFLSDYGPWLEKARGIVKFLLENQDSSGYMGKENPNNFQTLSQKEGELWGQCCFLRSMLAFYEYSQEKKYLEAVEKSVNQMISLFGEKSNRYFVGESTIEGGARAHGLMYIDVLERLYLLTGDQKYVNFAFRLFDDYSNSINLKNTDSQLDNLLNINLPYLHHAPHVAEHARVIYWLSTLSSDPKYRKAAQNSLEKLVQALSPSGGLVTDDRILESVGGKYGSAELRYEYCSIVETANSLESAFQKFGDISLAEQAENVVFNAGQAARFSDGKANAYCSKDNQIEASGTPDNSTFRYQYAACHRIACCVYNIGRLMPYYVSNMWMKGDNGKSLVAAFYGPSNLNTKITGVPIKIEQLTMYPFENEITMVVNPDDTVTFDILLRNPSWSKTTKVMAEGARILFEDDFIRLTKQWSKGDEVKIFFTPSVDVKVSYNNELYVKRGALLYALKINENRIATKIWDNPGFANYNIIPFDNKEVNRFQGYKLPVGSNINVLSDTTMFAYWKNPGSSLDFPYDTPYGTITATFLYNGQRVQEKLVPIGSTILRKTTFSTER